MTSNASSSETKNIHRSKRKLIIIKLIIKKRTDRNQLITTLKNALSSKRKWRTMDCGTIIIKFDENMQVRNNFRIIIFQFFTPAIKINFCFRNCDNDFSYTGNQPAIVRGEVENNIIFRAANKRGTPLYTAKEKRIFPVITLHRK